MHASASTPLQRTETAAGSLTHSLHALELAARKSDGITLNHVLRQHGNGAAYLLMIVLCLPFISPIPVPGLSNVVGLIVAWLAVRMVFTNSPALPRFLGDKKLSPKSSDRLIRSSVAVVSFLEKVTRRRYSNLFALKPVELVTLGGILVLGLLLALPIPPLIPFSNSLPALAIIVIALATMTGDGILIWAGYAIGLGALVYLTLFAGIIWRSVAELTAYVEKILT